jgi:hypothetical protein
MTSNVGDNPGRQGPAFFPASTPAFPLPVTAPATRAPTASLTERVKEVTSLDRTELEMATRSEMEQTLQGLLGALKNKSKAELEDGERHRDGSLSITSHVAVWLIGRITDAYGRKLVRLSKIPNRDNLRSIRGLAELLVRAIDRERGANAP